MYDMGLTVQSKHNSRGVSQLMIINMNTLAESLREALTMFPCTTAAGGNDVFEEKKKKNGEEKLPLKFKKLQKTKMQYP